MTNFSNLDFSFKNYSNTVEVSLCDQLKYHNDIRFYAIIFAVLFLIYVIFEDNKGLEKYKSLYLWFLTLYICGLVGMMFY